MITNHYLVECETMAGDPCVFPFYYNGSNHYACITHDNNGTPWCNFITAEGEFDRGNCMSDCPGKIVLNILCYYNDDQPLFS